MKFPRVLQIIVCLVLCVSIVFSLATPKAQAVAIVDDIGYIIWMILAAAGIVFPASNAAQIEGLGTSFTGFMDSEVGTEEEQSAWEEWCTAVGAILSSKDRPVDPRLAIPDVLLDLFALFAVKGAVAGYQCFPDESDGYASYNGFVLPAVPDLGYSYDGYVLADRGGSLEYYGYSLYAGDSFYLIDGILFANRPYQQALFADDVSSWSIGSRFTGTKSVTLDSDYIIWSSVPIYTDSSCTSLFVPSNTPSVSFGSTVSHSALLGELSSIDDPKDITADDIVIPSTFNPSWLWDDTKTKDEVVFATATDLAAGTLTHTDYLTMVQPSAEAGTEDDEDVVVGTLPVPTFWKGLTDVLSDVFVPDATYLASKVDALTSEFAFADSIISTGKMFGTELQDITTEPPVVYIDLPASTGSYALGPRMPFVDLSWYAEYKPTGDALISAFLWAIFAWRMFQKLPAVISGMPGDFVMTTIDESGLSGRLPSRKKEYEETRRRNRRF